MPRDSGTEDIEELKYEIKVYQKAADIAAYGVRKGKFLLLSVVALAVACIIIATTPAHVVAAHMAVVLGFMTLFVFCFVAAGITVMLELSCEITARQKVLSSLISQSSRQ